MSRIAFLAEVRNRALRPLQNNSTVAFDKLLFINDIIFNPVDAVQLLFSTNVDASGRAQYGAACAVDFIDAFKFYDRFATRDLEGNNMGIPIYPWFTNGGKAVSRQDVLAQKDAVRVKSCWGGMSAFEAKWFQGSHLDSSTIEPPPKAKFGDVEISPLRFRAERDTFWEGSECCLIHADLAYLRHGRNVTSDTGIYMNPYVRVAYDPSTLRWLPFTRRMERLYPIIQRIVNHFVGLPYSNKRRLEQPGDEVVEKVWKYDDDAQILDSNEDSVELSGSYHDVVRTAPPGRFCGGRGLLVLQEDMDNREQKWKSIPLPSIPERRL
jgi:Cryptococcal mannosyltransferase 1